MTGNRILVQELEPGAEDVLKAYLNQLVETIDRSADERRNGKVRQAQAGGAEERRQTAERVVQRFRDELTDVVKRPGGSPDG